MINTLDQIREWLILSGQPRLTIEEIDWVINTFPVEEAEICIVFSHFEDLLKMRVEKDNCYVIPIKVQEIGINNGCTIDDEMKQKHAVFLGFAII